MVKRRTGNAKAGTRASLACQTTNGDLPAELVRALEGSAEDLRLGRIVSLDGFIEEMEAELEAHLARKGMTILRR